MPSVRTAAVQGSESHDGSGQCGAPKLRWHNHHMKVQHPSPNYVARTAAADEALPRKKFVLKPRNCVPQITVWQRVP
jgi:hypothetical protein